MKKRTLLTVLAALSYPSAQFGNFEGWIDMGVSTWGHLWSMLSWGSSSLRVAQGKAMGGPGPGKVVNGVNLFTGQPTFSIPLDGLAVRSVGFPIVLNYFGGTKLTVTNDNQRAPTSWVGLGFDLSMPFVATNHKGTYTVTDDVLFCNLGPYGGGQLIQTSVGAKFYVSSNPYIAVAYETGTGEYAYQFTKWTFTFSDGKKMVFGQDTNSQRYVSYHNGKIVASPYTYAPQKKFIYRWDISTFYDSIPGSSPKNKILFQHERFLESTAANKSYVREAYVKNISWLENGLEAERIEFKTTPKGGNEYVGYGTIEPRDDQRLFETRRLDTLKHYREGELERFLKFDWISQPKGLLNRISAFHPRPKPWYLPPPVVPTPPIQDSGWTFAYEGISKHYLLKSITYPNARTDSYEYGIQNFGSTAGDLDATDYIMKRKDTVTAVPLPSSDASLGMWSAQASCDERFCYTLVRDGDTESLPNDTTATGAAIKQKIYVEIRRNLGNYIDKRYNDNSRSPADTITARFEMGDNTTPATDWFLIPSGDYVLIVNKAKGLIWLYENDGVKWVQQKPFTGDNRYNTSSGFGSEIYVFASGNYFLVQKRGTPTEVIVAYKSRTGWTSLNRDNVCLFDNKSDYGQSIRNTSTTPCLQWSSIDISFHLQPSYFLIRHHGNDVICAYAARSDDQGFIEVSQKFGSVSSPSDLRVAGKVMNWNYDIKDIYSTNDYFLVHSTQGSASWLHGFFFDGDTLGALLSHQAANTSIRAFPSHNYFILADASSGISFWRRTLNGTLYFSQQGTPRTDYNGSQKLLVRTHPNAFSIEYYTNDPSIGLRPKHESSSQYASYLYHVHPSHSNGWADRSSQLVRGGVGLGKKLFNISFSGSDNVLTGSYAETNGGGNCTEDIATGTCNITHFSGKTQPDNLTVFAVAPIDNVGMIPQDFQWIPLKQTHRVMSGAARLGVSVVLDKSIMPRRIHQRFFQFDGKSYWTPESVYVATSMTSDAGLDGADRNRVKYTFEYAPAYFGVREFNGNVSLPQFDYTEVTRRNSTHDSLGKIRVQFYLDKQSEPANGVTALLNGAEKNSQILNRGMDTSSSMTTKGYAYRNPAWPGPLYTVRNEATYSFAAGPNKGKISDTTYFLNYSDTNGAPRFTLNVSRPEKILLTQRVFDSKGFVKQSMVYKLPTMPNTDILKVWENGNSYADSPTVAATKAIYNEFYFVEDSIWRETDQSLTDQDLRSGKEPTFSILSGWLPGTKITRRDTANYFQIVETKSGKSKVPGALGEMYASTFYEGLRSDPVATVQNAMLENCAILMGESGNAGLPSNKLDHRGRWERFGVSFSNLKTRTGRYSLKVTDNFGPTVKLYLKDVRTLGYGFRVSAWIYSDGGTPILSIERRNSGGGIVDVTNGNPVVGNTGATRTWQRWEAYLPYAKLTANNLFNGSNDYLRIQVGTGSPSGNPSRILYVDDIVCVPTDAAFQLMTYDRRGLATSTTNMLFQTAFYDRSFKGQVMAVRDNENRTFGQGAGHAMGEN